MFSATDQLSGATQTVGEAGSWYTGRHEVGDDRQTQHTREWLEFAAILLNSYFHYILFKQRRNQKVMYHQLAQYESFF